MLYSGLLTELQSEHQSVVSEAPVAERPSSPCKGRSEVATQGRSKILSSQAVSQSWWALEWSLQMSLRETEGLCLEGSAHQDGVALQWATEDASRRPRGSWREFFKSESKKLLSTPVLLGKNVAQQCAN